MDDCFDILRVLFIESGAVEVKVTMRGSIDDGRLSNNEERKQMRIITRGTDVICPAVIIDDVVVKSQKAAVSSYFRDFVDRTSICI